LDAAIREVLRARMPGRSHSQRAYAVLYSGRAVSTNVPVSYRQNLQHHHCNCFELARFEHFSLLGGRQGSPQSKLHNILWQWFRLYAERAIFEVQRWDTRARKFRLRRERQAWDFSPLHGSDERRACKGAAVRRRRCLRGGRSLHTALPCSPPCVGIKPHVHCW